MFGNTPLTKPVSFTADAASKITHMQTEDGFPVTQLYLVDIVRRALDGEKTSDQIHTFHYIPFRGFVLLLDNKPDIIEVFRILDSVEYGHFLGTYNQALERAGSNPTIH